MTQDLKHAFTVYPVGRVKNSLTMEDLKPPGKSDPAGQRKALEAYREKVRETVSEIEILPEHRERMHGMEAFSHLQIVFWPHLIDEARRETLQQVHPRGMQEIEAQGIFATHSPVRPNPVLITTVRLVRRENLILYVKGLDCISGTPVIDIKPVLFKDEPVDDFRVPDWVNMLK